MGTPRKAKSTSRNCVTPTRQNLSYHEAFQFGNDTLHRSFSFQQLWSPGLNGQEGTAITQIAVSNYKLPHTPSQGNKRKKLTYDEGTPKKVKLARETKLLPNRILPMFAILIVAVASAAIGLCSLSCSDLPINSGYRTELETSLYGQREAVSKMIYVIERASSLRNIEDGNIILVSVGPVGVGKSYASSIIKKYFPHQNNIFFVAASSLSSDFLENTLTDCWTLLAVEDCSMDNVNKVFDIFANHKDRTEPLLILLMLSAVDNNVTFKKMDRYEIHTIPFSPLNEDDVRKCFIQELMKHHYYRYSDDELSSLVTEQMRVIPEVGYRPGCKLVSERVIQFLADKHINMPYS